MYRYLETYDFSNFGVCIDDNGEVILKNKHKENLINKEIYLLEEIEILVETLTKVIKQKDIERINQVAHKIKLLSNEIGLEELKVLAFKVELAARRGNIEDAVNKAKDIPYVFQVIKKSMS